MSTVNNAAAEFTIADLNKIIEAISKGQAKTAKDIGRAIMVALYLANVNKDAGGANALISCLRKSTKQQAIIDLLESEGNLAWMKTEKKFSYFDAGCVWPTEKATKEELRKVCDAWESFKVQKVAEALDVLAKLEALAKAVDSAKKNARTVIHEELAERVAALIAEAHAKSFK